MRMMMRAAGLAALVALAGCADNSKDLEVAQQAQSRLVGLPKGKLLACAGVPSRQAVVNGSEYLTYSQRPVFAEDGPSATVGVDPASVDTLGLGIGIGVPAFASRATQGCDATFVLRGGVVQEVTYPAGANLGDCGAVVSNCMAP